MSSSSTLSNSPKTTSISLSQSMPSPKSSSSSPIGSFSKSSKSSMELVEVKTNAKGTEILIEDSPKNEKKNQQTEIVRQQQDELEQLRAEKEKLKKELNLVKRKVTGYVDPTSGTIAIDSITLKNAILEKVKNVYDSISVEQIDYQFGGEANLLPTRKITLERTWTLLDVTAFSIPFFSILFNPDSIYKRCIDKNSLAKYVLDAEETYEEPVLLKVFLNAQKDFEKSKNHAIDSSKIDEFKKAAEDTFCQKINPPEEINADLKSFLSIYKKHFELSYPDPKKNLAAVYWQSKSIIIYVPNDCKRNAEVVLEAKGVVTHLSISVAKFLKSLGF